MTSTRDRAIEGMACAWLLGLLSILAPNAVEGWEWILPIGCYFMSWIAFCYGFSNTLDYLKDNR